MNTTTIATRQLKSAHGWGWIVNGFALFKRSPVIWIALFFVYLLIGMLLSTVKIVGPVVLNLLAPVFVAGFMLGCRDLDKGEELEINHLFAGFRHHAAQLVTVGGIYLTGIIIIVGIMFAGADNSVLQAMVSGEKLTHEQASAALSGGFALSSLLGLFMLVPLIMAYWFAPVLVAFHGLSGPQAMKQSLYACLRNIGPFFVYSLISMALLILAALPLFLGMLIMIPTMTASLYSSYKDIFDISNAPQEDIDED